MQGYITTDIDAYVGASPPTAITYMEDGTGSNLVLNISVAYAGSAPRISQVSFSATSAAYYSPCTASCTIRLLDCDEPLPCGIYA